MSAAEQAPASPRMTYEAFIEWADEDTLAEWVDGEVIMTSPASLRHQEVKLFLVEMLRRFVAVHRLGKVLDAPLQMKLPTSGREPDVLFIATEHLDRLRPTYLDGPADLVIEVISPESVKRDREQKFFEYQAAGVPEYWLIDPAAQVAECYQLTQFDDQRFYRRVAEDDQGTYQSAAVPGFWLRVAWLWQDPPPAVDDVLFEVIGQAYLDHLSERARQLGLTLPRASTE